MEQVLEREDTYKTRSERCDPAELLGSASPTLESQIATGLLAAIREEIARQLGDPMNAVVEKTAERLISAYTAALGIDPRELMHRLHTVPDEIGDKNFALSQQRTALRQIEQEYDAAAAMIRWQANNNGAGEKSNADTRKALVEKMLLEDPGAASLAEAKAQAEEALKLAEDERDLLKSRDKNNRAMVRWGAALLTAGTASDDDE